MNRGEGWPVAECKRWTPIGEREDGVYVALETHPSHNFHVAEHQTLGRRFSRELTE